MVQQFGKHIVLEFTNDPSKCNHDYSEPEFKSPHELDHQCATPIAYPMKSEIEIYQILSVKFSEYFFLSLCQEIEHRKFRRFSSI